MAIDDALARWDRVHMHEFHLADHTRLTTPYAHVDELGPWLDDWQVKLSRLQPGEQFLYTFDLGDDWTACPAPLIRQDDPVPWAEAIGSLTAA